MSDVHEARRAELFAALAALRARIADAAEAAGRPAEDVTVIAVTKTRPPEDAALLVDLGVTDLGESKDQEAAAKVAAVADLSDVPVRWHFVGRLQTNKARSVASYASAVHSLDRPELAAALARGCERAGRNEPLEVFVQVSLDGDPTRGGVTEAGLPALADAVAGHAALRLVGVMAVPPIGADPAAAFGRLAELSGRLDAAHPGASLISAGMSDDLDAAVGAGSTHVRVGSALLGRRNDKFS